MVQIDPILAGMIVVLLGFFFFLYLMLRRTVLSFKEGVEGNDRRR